MASYIRRRKFLATLGGAVVSPLAALLVVAALIAAIPALAHSWYPLACCGNMDCFPVACNQLVETGSGWFYVPTGNLYQNSQTLTHAASASPGHSLQKRTVVQWDMGAVLGRGRWAQVSQRLRSLVLIAPGGIADILRVKPSPGGYAFG